MLLRAAAEHHLDLGASFAIGDKKSDVAAGRAAGCRTVLLRTGKAGSGESELNVQPDFLCDDLLAAAWQIEAVSSRPTAIPPLGNYAYPATDLDSAIR
jgi:D-glycero-D-manno-heptose 1,7-bisphosphate phosphatase